jgi:hypothetical protein
MPRTVAIVLDSDYSAALEKLAFTTPVWIVDTPENRSAAEQVWHAANEWPHLTVTLFRAPVGTATKDDWRTLLEQIAFQEKAADTIEVIGSPLTLAARAALTDAGFQRFEETADGVRARR